MLLLYHSDVVVRLHCKRKERTMDDITNEVVATDAIETATEVQATPDAQADAPTVAKRKAGASGKRVKTDKGTVTAGMPDVKRIEGKDQCRVAVMLRAKSGKESILKVGKAEVTTPIRHSTRDKAAAIIGEQKRRLRAGHYGDAFSKAIADAGNAVVYRLQWLAGREWVNHESK